MGKMSALFTDACEVMDKIEEQKQLDNSDIAIMKVTVRIHRHTANKKTVDISNIESLKREFVATMTEV